ncbi:hypothetical protein M8C21_016960 [Ambrosia artemisiifolia]|uniref:Uncharacterized protein n=1 Tax=Ambrosia artemisiifolia TaxID=4212 RepID=A0AAD5G1K1_AMBAR|nr:hypothetical protein M8C21_016960 [Ambrosia artemisiifolia]
MSTMRRDPDKLPSTTAVNPAHQASTMKNVHINAMTKSKNFGKGKGKEAESSQQREDQGLGSIIKMTELYEQFVGFYGGPPGPSY